MDKRQFYKYLRRSRRFISDTSELMHKIKAPTNLREYDVQRFGNVVIDYFNDKYKQQQHKFKLFVFNAYGNYKPAYKYGADDYTKPLVLYYDDKHFDGIRNPNELFGQNYCLACEMPYDKTNNHAFKCKQRCMLCSQIGPQFPCKVIGNFYKQCEGCQKTFDNEDCYKQHKINKFCSKSKKCLDCGVIWSSIKNHKRARDYHVCHETFCPICHIFHNPERSSFILNLFIFILSTFFVAGCFIEPIKAPKQDLYRVIAFDCESKQHLVVDEQRNKRLHQVNFIAAHVACADCISSGKWRETLQDGQGCMVCGKHRTVAFAECGFSDTNVDKLVVTDDPALAFIKWLLYEMPLAYQSVIFSHYGGRFFHLLFYSIYAIFLIDLTSFFFSANFFLRA